LIKSSNVLGTSISSTNKTFAENLTYNQQEKIFSKIDMFYQKLWLLQKIFD